MKLNFLRWKKKNIRKDLLLIIDINYGIIREEFSIVIYFLEN